MGAIGRHEVDQRFRVLEVLPEVGPAGVGRQLAVVGLPEELPPDIVERRDARLPGPGQVERRKVQRQTQQVAAQRLRHEFVELVADLIRRAHDDAARRPAPG